MSLTSSLTALLRNNTPEVLGALVVVNALVLLVLLRALLRVAKLDRLYRKLTRGTSGGNLEERFDDYLGTVEVVAQRTETTQQRIERIERRQRCALQRVGMVRFDAFEEVGGQQSFVIAVTDEDRNGFVISSVYSRADVRVYAKSLAQGQPSHPLTAEERQALAAAEGR